MWNRVFKDKPQNEINFYFFILIYDIFFRDEIESIERNKISMKQKKKCGKTHITFTSCGNKGKMTMNNFNNSCNINVVTQTEYKYTIELVPKNGKELFENRW